MLFVYVNVYFFPIVSQGNENSRTKPVPLTALDRDCFIIPVQSIARFLPAGIMVKC